MKNILFRQLPLKCVYTLPELCKIRFGIYTAGIAWTWLQLHTYKKINSLKQMLKRDQV